ncbi:conjugal transfer pilus assembly protein TraU [Aquamicrobium sp.]|uniref:conjugal transfer pilus assembly protein TraU n=1 Tax=Aquamicrobium sp. TaxID=1872579 RepID=UPI0025897CE3|nr:conjugal transfer pilus assembly protein TraU [Aquamicrobium sp.]MCK9553907.1 TraU family protein [Aquamicrobium sp.]
MKRVFSLLTLLFCFWVAAPQEARAAGVGSCTGSFVNPITDISWGSLFPLTIGPLEIWPSGEPDTPNPSLPVCACLDPIPRIGISVGFWEPVRLADASMKPWCFVNLGGLKLDPGFDIGYKGLQGPSAVGGKQQFSGDWHVHWYMYPLIAWMELVANFACLEVAGIDIMYMTEIDPLWQNSELTTILNPEAILFANPIALAACAADCVAATVGLPLDPLFWCAGCQGGMYPLNGKISAQSGHVQGSRLAVERFAFKLHRMGVLWGSFGGAGLCGSYPMPIMMKSQYRIAATNPVTSGTKPIGAQTLTGAGRMIPAIGEDMGYLVWRKRNCCLL